MSLKNSIIWYDRFFICIHLLFDQFKAENVKNNYL